MFKQYKRLIQILAAAVLTAWNTALYMICWYTAISQGAHIWYFRRGNWVMAALYVLLILLFARMYGGFRMGYLERNNVIFSQVLSMFFVNLITYFQIALIAYRFPPVLPFFGLLLVQMLVILAWSWGYGRLYRKLFPPRRILFVYHDPSAQALLDKMRTRGDQYEIARTISTDEGMDAVRGLLTGFDGVMLADIPTPFRNLILKECFDRSVRVYMTPKISDILVRSAEEMHIFDTPLLLSRNSGLTIEQRAVKRCFDLMVSAGMLIMASPVFLITALAIKCCDGGPVFFKQKRLTIDHKEFWVYKFRSMRVDAEKDGVAKLAEQGDARITPVGRIIRAMRIDELPQILNILKGEMSLVGPRPERPELAARYEKEIPQFGSRLKVKAGLTGYAQIFGKYNTTAYDKLKMDLTYIQTYSILLDIKLVILTVKILFMKESTEGVKAERKADD